MKNNLLCNFAIFDGLGHNLHPLHCDPIAWSHRDLVVGVATLGCRALPIAKIESMSVHVYIYVHNCMYTDMYICIYTCIKEYLTLQIWFGVCSGSHKWDANVYNRRCLIKYDLIASNQSNRALQSMIDQGRCDIYVYIVL